MAVTVIVMQFEFDAASCVPAIMHPAGDINLPAALFEVANRYFDRFALIEKEENPGAENRGAN